MEEAVPGPLHGPDQMLFGAKQPFALGGEYLFGPGAIEQAQDEDATCPGWFVTPPEKIVQEVRPRSPGWQL